LDDKRGSYSTINAHWAQMPIYRHKTPIVKKFEILHIFKLFLLNFGYCYF